jgi:hypothetical protein
MPDGRFASVPVPAWLFLHQVPRRVWARQSAIPRGGDSVTRQCVLSVLSVVVLLVFGMLPSVAAQDATPASRRADLALPALEVTVIASG